MSEDKTYELLIVDDQPDNAFLLEMLLKRQKNFVVHTVEDGQQALDFVEKNHIDLVLMDVMMPVMNGNDATKELRKTHDPSVLPIIMVTTLSDVDNLVESFEAGANDYVTKPIEWNALKARITSGLRIRDAVLREKILLEKTENLNQRLKQFSFSVAHDIRNPLAHIRVLCGALNDEILPKEEVITQIDELAEKAYTFLDSILEHSAYGKAEDIDWISMPDLIRDVCKFLGASIEKNQAEIIVDELPNIMGSYGLIFQLILNLVGNAIKYREASRPLQVTIFSEENSEEKIICISDNGVGMSEEDLHIVSKPLTRGQSSQGTEGSGLGLSLANNIMTEFEGKLEIHSKLGEGTTIKLYFPKKNEQRGH